MINIWSSTKIIYKNNNNNEFSYLSIITISIIVHNFFHHTFQFKNFIWNQLKNQSDFGGITQCFTRGESGPLTKVSIGRRKECIDKNKKQKSLNGSVPESMSILFFHFYLILHGCALLNEEKITQKVSTSELFRFGPEKFTLFPLKVFRDFISQNVFALNWIAWIFCVHIRLTILLGIWGNQR